MLKNKTLTMPGTMSVKYSSFLLLREQSRNFLSSMERVDFLLCPQQPANELLPDLDKSRPELQACVFRSSSNPY